MPSRTARLRAASKYFCAISSPSEWPSSSSASTSSFSFGGCVIPLVRRMRRHLLLAVFLFGVDFVFLFLGGCVIQSLESPSSLGVAVFLFGGVAVFLFGVDIVFLVRRMRNSSRSADASTSSFGRLPLRRRLRLSLSRRMRNSVT